MFNNYVISNDITIEFTRVFDKFNFLQNSQSIHPLSSSSSSLEEIMGRLKKNCKNDKNLPMFNYTKFWNVKLISQMHGLPTEITDIINKIGIKLFEKDVDEFLIQLKAQNNAISLISSKF